mmetsp:Transcript_49782/g.98799  ORF Transcript_49782/g.98799 Transcript_49782/m.98799 type:complete len:221 (-) Transcript_49782:47-709(-)
MFRITVLNFAVHRIGQSVVRTVPMTTETRQRSAMLSSFMLCGVVLMFVSFTTKLTFASFTNLTAVRSHVSRRAELGKVNLGEVEDDPSAENDPADFWKSYGSVMSMDVDAVVVGAIQNCVEEGCSVEAIMKLDTVLAENEKMVVSEKSKTSDKTAVAWLDNFLSKTVSLRSQLLAVKPAMPSLGKDSDFLKQMIKAAAIAFGASPRGNDYPKVGVSSYSA